MPGSNLSQLRLLLMTAVIGQRATWSETTPRREGAGVGHHARNDIEPLAALVQALTETLEAAVEAANDYQDRTRTRAIECC